MPDGLLDSINSPADLRGMSAEDLVRLAREIRTLITKTVAARGGHLASNLGVVDLTLALHRAFDFSRDHLIWDVGHQCYAHKILTGRKAGFANLRTAGGASGFPNPAESPYDLFRTGHAGTSLSTALGLALAEKAAGSGVRTVAVIGDGALGAGMALEAINHAGEVGGDLLIILNDNQMAIGPTVGGLARYLTRMRTTAAYGNLKQDVHEVLDKLPLGEPLARAIHAFKNTLKEAVIPDHVFERWGLRCFGPVDGHHIGDLMEARAHPQGLRFRPGGRGARGLAQRQAVYRVQRPGGPRVGVRRAVDMDVCRRERASGPREVRRADRGHHRRHARRHGPPALRPPVPGPVLRCGHLRAARRGDGSGPGARRPASGRRDLLHVPPAGVRPVVSRGRWSC
jgi:transketolase N-terminal domain/subunit